MRLRFTKRLLIFVISGSLIVLFVMKLRSVSRSTKILDSDCNVPADVRENVIVILADSNRILKQLQLTHFLCYGTLWGVLKMERILPWEDNAEVCVLNEELSRYEEAFIIRTFRRHHLVLQYDSQDGVYEVYSVVAGREKGVIRLVVFERDPEQDMMKRVGWTRRVLPPSCELSPSLHCFPSRLVEKPLPTVVLDGTQYEVPREEVEIQKYLYPDTWWKNVKPSEC